jgi:hypothetical protein
MKLEDYSLSELKAIAKNNKIRGYSKMKKGDLASMMRETLDVVESDNKIKIKQKPVEKKKRETKKDEKKSLLPTGEPSIKGTELNKALNNKLKITSNDKAITIAKASGKVSKKEHAAAKEFFPELNVDHVGGKIIISVKE